MKISKEQVKQLYKNNLDCKVQLVDADLKSWFPEAFTELVKIGEWYKTKFTPLFFLERMDKKIGYGYGIYKDKFENGIGLFVKDLIKLSNEEIEKVLICEAKKRGFVEGVLFIPTNGSGIVRCNYRERYGFDVEKNKLLLNNLSIFQEGKWAVTIKEEVYFSKPCLSLNDLLNAWGGNDHLSNIDDFKQSPLFNNLKKAVENKLNAKTTESNFLLINKYVDDNKNPKSKGILSQENINNIETFFTEVKYTIKK